MSKKTIARFSAFVICIAAAWAVFPSCAAYNGGSPEKPGAISHRAARVVGKISSKAINESSGVAASNVTKAFFGHTTIQVTTPISLQ
jgi:hypothetical protein